ncbi:hypothetical protein [Levilactobacillus spicheri]
MHQPQQAVTDCTQIHQFIQAGHVLQLALNDGVYPYVVPVNYTSTSTAHRSVRSGP